MKQSSGTLLYRYGPQGLEVLLVHPSGSYNRRAPWGIPKGAPNPGETMEQTARRETLEETGVIAGELVAIGHIDYTRSRKRVFCFIGLATMETTPSCASWEVDQVGFIPFARARQLIHMDQLTFLDRLLELIEQQPPSTTE